MEIRGLLPVRTEDVCCFCSVVIFFLHIWCYFAAISVQHKPADPGSVVLPYNCACNTYVTMFYAHYWVLIVPLWRLSLIIITVSENCRLKLNFDSIPVKILVFIKWKQLCMVIICLMPLTGCKKQQWPANCFWANGAKLPLRIQSLPRAKSSLLDVCAELECAFI